jgi:hypothetical protein
MAVSLHKDGQAQVGDLASRLKFEPNPALLEDARKRAESVQNRIRRQDHGVRRIDGVRLHPRHLVRLLDRRRRREVPIRPPDDDRLTRGDLPFELRDDQPNRADAKRQVIADQQWQTVKEEDNQNQELLALSKPILELTKSVHEYATARSDGVEPKPDA